MRQREGTARRYAKAFIGLTGEDGGGEKAARELSEFRDLLSGQPELRSALTYPWVKGSDKQAVAIAAARRMEASPRTRDFLGLLAFRGRLDHLPEIVQAYRQLLDEAEGRVRAVVTSTIPMSERERDLLAERLSRALGKRVLLEERVDTRLLGGFIVEIGSIVLDASLDGELLQLRERFVKGEGGS